ncbi:RhuM family protein [Corynebacterium phoceense]|uniref:RhuM family protein n=1 Tax=Corynebacterium phoceense TaxID=1686286 RepID=UPI00352487CF
MRRTRRETLQVRTEGSREVTRQRAEYSLEMLIAVGLRLRGARADALRAWVARTIPSPSSGTIDAA